MYRAGTGMNTYLALAGTPKIRYEHLYMIINVTMDAIQMLGGGQPGLRAEPTERQPIYKPEHAVPAQTPEDVQPAVAEPAIAEPVAPEPIIEPTSVEPEPVIEAPIEDTPKDPVTSEELKEIEKEALEREEEKIEQIKAETADTTEEFKQQVFEMLIEDQTKLEIELEKATKSYKYYKNEYDTLAKEHNALKYDDRKVAISEEHRPIVRLLEQYKVTPDDVNIKTRLLVQLFDIASSVDGTDYLTEMKKFQSNNGKQITDLSKNISSYSTVPEQQPVARKTTGILVKPGGRRF